MTYMHEYAKPFFLQGNDIGCLLIHGFTGTPAHMRILGDVLNKEGYTVKAIVLKGHSTTLEDLEKANWKDWVEDVSQAYNELKKQCSKIYVIGLSMGAMLSFILAEKYPVDKVVSISGSVKIYDRFAIFAFAARYFLRYSMWNPLPTHEGENLDYCIGYSGVPVKCVPSFLKIVRMAKSGFAKVKCPALIVQSYNDETVIPESAKIIYNNIASEQKDILWLQRSKHVCTLGPEREVIHEKIISFLK